MAKPGPRRLVTRGEAAVTSATGPQSPGNASDRAWTGAELSGEPIGAGLTITPHDRNDGWQTNSQKKHGGQA